MVQLVERAKEAGRKLLNGKNGHSLELIERRLPAGVMVQGTAPAEKVTVCPRCGSNDIDDIWYRGKDGEEFHKDAQGVSTGILKHEDERMAPILVGQICRGFIAISATEEERCGIRLWSAPVVQPIRGRRPIA